MELTEKSIVCGYPYAGKTFTDPKADSLPEQATVDEAIALYLADKCSLGRSAELAGVTRWDLIDTLKERNIPIMVASEFTVAEMDAIEKELEREGLLCR